MSDRETVLFANQAFYAAFSNRDMQAMAELWCADKPVTCIHPGWPVVRGFEEVLQSWQGILGNPQAPKIKDLAAEVVVTGDVAVVTCVECLNERNYLAATNVFVRTGGRWMMLHHHAGPANIDPRTLPQTDALPRGAMN